jgi:hypothetical protein
MMIQIHCLCLYLANVVLFFSLFGGDWSDPIRYVHYWECPPSWLRGISSLSGRLQGSVLTLGGDRLQGSVCTLHGGRLQGSVLTHAVGGRLQGSMRTDWSIVISLFLFFSFFIFLCCIPLVVYLRLNFDQGGRFDVLFVVVEMMLLFVFRCVVSFRRARA